MITSTAFSPCQITGFFSIQDHPRDVLRKGSTGAGVCLDQGVTTRIRVSRIARSSSIIKVEANGRLLRNPIVSRLVAENYTRVAGPIRVESEHTSKLPMGCGYGTSGAGALSLSLALNEALGSPLTNLEASGVAHSAEVQARTGLGTVLAEFTGGLVVRLKAGGPGIGETRKIRVGRSARVVSASYGPIRTSRVLGSTGLRSRVNRCGNGLTTRLLRSPNIETFRRLSRTFTDCLSLASGRVERALVAWDREGFVGSMMMLGESMFTITEQDRVTNAVKTLREVGLRPIVSRIASAGAHVS